MPMIRRGDVVIADVPFTDVARSKVRPAIVVQNDRDNSRLRKTVIVFITGNRKRQGDPSHFLIDPGSPEGASSGIHGISLASCNNVYTCFAHLFGKSEDGQNGLLPISPSLPN